MELFRPVGQKEYELIEQSGFKSFPPRLPGQPIFYPVLNEKYAIEIASKWNTEDSLFSGNVGYVLRFNISDEYISRFDNNGDKKWSERGDSNSWPFAPHANTLPSCATPR